jgi:hypothetical protein
MKTLYIECNMGVAGDMLMGALLELIDDKEQFLRQMNDLNIPDIRVESSPCMKCGIKGSQITVKINGTEEEHIHAHSHGEEHSHTHHHSSMEHIMEIIAGMNVSQEVKKDVEGVYKIIAKAESMVHGREVSQVHFHEVGMLDAIADITGCCLLIEKIKPERIVVSPIKTGFGQVHCAHGIMPVPAPATALILQGIPNSAGKTEGELCTPTGAALIKYFADEYGYQPEMTTDKIGYGMGKKDFEAANCVRALLGEKSDNTEYEDNVVELCCNLDDMTSEEIGYAVETLMQGKALDVYTTPVGMKKSRTGILLSVLCRPENKEEVVREIFRQTTTLGIREYLCRRYVLKRSIETLQTEYGTVRMKKSQGYGVKREKPEFEDVKKIAESTGKNLKTVKRDLKI